MAHRHPLPATDVKTQDLTRIATDKSSSSRQEHSGSTAANATRQETVAETTPSPGPQRRTIVFPDPVAFRYLEEDPCVQVVERKGILRGYELYLVEQWACSRLSPTVVIVTYTGDEKDCVVVGVLAIPEDESTWSPRLRVLFKAIQLYHARPKVTPLGELMVTNLSSFPSALTVIPVPDGDIKKHRQVFMVNENLKRLGCSGRLGMTLTGPTAAAKAKFLQLFKTSENISFADSVVELVKLCQVALLLFGKLEQEYVDGLLCDITEKAIGNWWTEFGAEYYNIEPSDGILGPTTVATLLGLLMGARNRLSSYGAPVTKDVFDIDATKKGISYFQKSQKLERTRRLDRQTLHRLHGVTAKAAAGEGWGVQKAVKSTVSEIGGKRGEIVLGMVGGRDKGGIGDIETADLDKFISLVQGERAKWLWLGKAKRPTADNHESILELGNMLFDKEDAHGHTKRIQSTPLDDETDGRVKEKPAGVYSSHPPPGSASSIPESPAEKDGSGPRKGVFKSVAGNARSGFGRIKDAVYSGGGLRGHATRPSKDDSSEMAFSTPTPSGSSGLAMGQVSATGGSGRSFTWKNLPVDYHDGFRRHDPLGSSPASLRLGQADMIPKEGVSTVKAAANEEAINPTLQPKLQKHGLQGHNDVPAFNTSVANSPADENEARRSVLEVQHRLDPTLSWLHRRHSIADTPPKQHVLNESKWPGRLSFSTAEDAILRWTDLAELDQDDDDDMTTALRDKHALLAEIARGLYDSMTEIRRSLQPAVQARTMSIETLDDHYAHQQDEIQTAYLRLAGAHEQARQASQQAVADERAHVTEAVKEVEVLVAKLEYEINALVSRVQDVEDGVVQFELQVDAVEKRADELKGTLETEGWLHWTVRKMTGIGSGPPIADRT